MGLHGVHHALKRLQYYRLVSSCEISTSFPLCDFCSLQNDLWGWCFSCVWFLFFTKRVFGNSKRSLWNSKRSPKILYKMTPGDFQVPKNMTTILIILIYFDGFFFGKRCHFTKWVLSVSSTCVPLQNGMGQLRGVEHTQLVETHFWVPPWVLYKMPLHDPKG